MKKLLILACAAGLMAVSSCNGGSASSDKLATAEDSLNHYLGSFYGSMVAQQAKSGPDSAKFDKNEFLKGVKMMMDVDTTKQSYLQGINMGMQLLMTMQQFKAQDNITINGDKVYAALKTSLMSDSIQDPMAARTIVGTLLERMHNEKVANSPEALKNKKAGEAYVNDVMKKDPSVKKTASGLAYKVVKEGAGAKFGAADRINVKYTGKHIDGKEFDSSNGKEVVFMPNAMTPGFKEALLMMAPGAEYILYVPAELAYGAEGQPQAGIQPNETLVFEVSTVGLAPAENAAAPQK